MHACSREHCTLNVSQPGSGDTPDTVILKYTPSHTGTVDCMLSIHYTQQLLMGVHSKLLYEVGVNARALFRTNEVQKGMDINSEFYGTCSQ